MAAIRRRKKPSTEDIPKASPPVSSTKGKFREVPQKEGETRPPKLRVWVLACRPHTLTASIAPILVGWAVIIHHQHHCTDIDSNTYSDIESNRPNLNHVTILFGTFACLIQ
eukprot:CAMPEP_0197253234 /NCGR_PEP_ID=MMETSP1429-20130617/64247_1 /TAXON_ID=49237 /ORGANISM="Chaetoceros  sp., Strain UNC1202" /LENGTH=110 /DNA_ID=CAMNT_0042715839 /DNA_START=124 /DNA_END=453 /DNA_ORIENTATION=+